jgi:hypothetical protein
VTTVHIYRARPQSAVRFEIPFVDPPIVVKNPPTRLLYCFKCRQKQRARHMTAHAYYDGTYYFCVQCPKKRKKRK